MLNKNKNRNNIEAYKYTIYNTIYNRDELDIRLLKDVKQLDEILSKTQRGPVCLYLNKGLVKLGTQAILLLYSRGAPFTSLSQYIETAIYDLVKKVVSSQEATSEPVEEHEKRQLIEEKRESEKPKCWLHTCNKPAIKAAINKESGKKHYFCMDHIQEILKEYKDKWIVLDEPVL